MGRIPKGTLLVGTCPATRELATSHLLRPFFLFCWLEQGLPVGVRGAGGRGDAAANFEVLGPGSPSWPQEPSRVTAAAGALLSL